MTVKTLDRILISVSNLEESLAFYRDWVGMKVDGQQDLSLEELSGLYGLRLNTSARAVYLSNGVQATRIELVQVKPPTGKPIRSQGNDWNYGIYDVAFMVRGVDEIYRSLTAKGFTAVNPPVEYSPLGNPVKETIIIGPDNTRIAHLERLVPNRQEVPSKYLSIADSAQIVPDVGEALNFYCGIIGLDLMNRVTLPPGTLDDILGLPEGTRAELAFVGRLSSREPMIVLIGLSVPAKRLDEAGWLPNLGVCAISFEVANVDRTLDIVRGAGYRVISGPAEFRRLLYGKVRAVTINGPAGVMIELVERWPANRPR